VPDPAVKESRERIKSAQVNSGFGYPPKSLTINLAPANVRKEGAGFDFRWRSAFWARWDASGKTEEHHLIGESVPAGGGVPA